MEFKLEENRLLLYIMEVRRRMIRYEDLGFKNHQISFLKIIFSPSIYFIGIHAS